ncbi:MAG: M20/M25/M40 family metallo-hydrolase [Verrucomicrobia bacterium]|nr:M20/M25/M40 family metallo-hydrolase [Verrucomicrobiota bacterium]
MRRLLLAGLLLCATTAATPALGSPEADTVNRFFTEALEHSPAYDHLRELTTRYPGRLAGTAALDGAIEWAQRVLGATGVDRVYTQDVMAPHWDRGAPESVQLLLPSGRVPLAAAALGNTGSTPPEGVTGEVLMVHSLAEVERLGPAGAAGKIIFYNRPMPPRFAYTFDAYGAAGDQRNQGPVVAARHGAVAALVRSLTLAHDDVPHTGNSAHPVDGPPFPAAALSTVAADRLAEALAADPHIRVSVTLHGRILPDAPTRNVIGEIRGSEFPNQVIVVGGHLDSWDITPGAHDDGAGVVQAVEVLRLFHALGLKPRHTLRCVMFTNEENGLAGATRYASIARQAGERHILAVESDSGGFTPMGFNLGSTQGNAHERAQRWRPLFEPWGIWRFSKGTGGADVNQLLLLGVPVAGLAPDSQRYFDYHHTAIDTIDKVNPRELNLGAAAIAALVWLVDTDGL